MPEKLSIGATETVKAIWKVNVLRYVKRKEKLDENIGSLYSLILGQITDDLKAKLTGANDFNKIYEENNAIMLLKAVNKILSNFEAHKNLHAVMWAMEKQVCNTHQNNLDLSQYLKIL